MQNFAAQARSRLRRLSRCDVLFLKDK